MKAIDRMLQRWRINKTRPWLQPGMRVLDIGCADGALFRLIPEIQDGVGIDPDIATSQQIGTNVLVPGLFPEALPDGRLFDAISMLAVLEHVPTHLQDRLARDSIAALVPGGYLLITVPSPATDHVLAALRSMRLIHGMSLEQHYGFEVSQTPNIFGRAGFEMICRRRFQLGFNNFFAFRKPTTPA